MRPRVGLDASGTGLARLLLLAPAPGAVFTSSHRGQVASLGVLSLATVAAHGSASGADGPLAECTARPHLKLAARSGLRKAEGPGHSATSPVLSMEGIARGREVGCRDALVLWNETLTEKLAGVFAHQNS